MSFYCFSLISESMSALVTKAVPKNCGNETAVAVPVLPVVVMSVEYSTTSTNSGVLLL